MYKGSLEIFLDPQLQSYSIWPYSRLLFSDEFELYYCNLYENK